MKHLVVLLIALTCCLAAWADDVEIPLENTTTPSGQAGNEQQKDKRSLLFAPEASHDGNIVYIYSCIPMEEIQITVLDEAGNVVYENVVVGSCAFTVESQVKGGFILILNIDSTEYTGTFFIE